MARAKNGEAIAEEWRSRGERRRLQALLVKSAKRGELKTWRRAKAVTAYLQGVSVISVAAQLGVTRGSVNRWLQWFDAQGTEGLLPRKHPGGAPRMTDVQAAELVCAVYAGPEACGFSAGMWTGPMIGDFISRHMGIRFHNHYIPVLLHQLGFSVQRPRKRLARADLQRQHYWIQKRFPAIKKKRRRAAA